MHRFEHPFLHDNYGGSRTSECTCVMLPADGEAPDLPCPSCRSVLQDLLAHKGSGPPRWTWEHEHQRLRALLEAHDLLETACWQDGIDRAFYARYTAKLRRQEDGITVPMFNTETIWGKGHLLFIIALARDTLDRHGIDWRSPLLDAYPLSLPEAEKRRTSWATVAEVLAAPALTVEQAEQNDMTALLLESLLSSTDSSSDLTVTSSQIDAIIGEISDQAAWQIRRRLDAVSRIELVAFWGDQRAPTIVARWLATRTDDAGPLALCLYAGKDGENSRTVILDPERLARTLDYGLGQLRGFLDPERLRTHWPNMPGSGPVSAHPLNDYFCPRSLLPSTPETTDDSKT